MQMSSQLGESRTVLQRGAQWSLGHSCLWPPGTSGTPNAFSIRDSKHSSAVTHNVQPCSRAPGVPHASLRTIIVAASAAA
jgi:hypothetical protein